MTMQVRTVVLGFLVTALPGCGGQGGVATQPSSPSTPSPTPTLAGSFSVVSSNPAVGATVFGESSDLQGTSGLAVTIQTTSATSVSSAYFVLSLLNGTTECLRTQIAYCDRTDGLSGSYSAGVPATYRCTFFVRGNQEPSCGARFTTNRVRFTLQTGGRDTLFAQETAGGWSFVFAR